MGRLAAARRGPDRHRVHDREERHLRAALGRALAAGSPPLVSRHGRVSPFHSAAGPSPRPDPGRAVAARGGAAVGAAADEPGTTTLAGRGLARACCLISGYVAEDRFWTESWTSTERVLAQVTDWLRRSHAVHAIEIDEGWSDDRDVSVFVGRWAWLDIRALVEDHGSGRALLRVSTHLRPAELRRRERPVRGSRAAGCRSLRAGEASCPCRAPSP